MRTDSGVSALADTKILFPITRPRTLAQEAVLWGLAGLGVALRARQYGSRGSLWTDEARTALDVEHLGFLGLTRPLPLLQGAPFGYLWTERASYLILGNSEYSFRLMSFLAGLATVLLFRVLARRSLPGWPACLAMGIVAVSPFLVQYSSQVKAYENDAAATVAILLVGLWALDGGLSARRRWTWAVLATVLALFSYASIFSAAAIAVLLVVQALRHRSLSSALQVVAGSVLWAGVFLFQYFVALRPVADTPFIKAFWAPGYDPDPASASTTFHWLASRLFSVAHNPIELVPAWLACVLMIVGLVAMARRQPWTAAAVTLTGFIVIVAGVAGRYPLDGRMVLFLVPLAALAVAGAVTLVTAGVGRWLLPRLAAACLVLVVAGTSVISAAENAARPPVTTAFREAYLYARRHRAPDDPVYINNMEAAVFVYYRPLLHLHPRATLSLTTSGTCNEVRVWSVLDSSPRFWMVLGIPADIYPGIQGYLRVLSMLGRVTYHRTSYGAGAALVVVEDSKSVQAAIRLTQRRCLSLEALPSYSSLKHTLDGGLLSEFPGRGHDLRTGAVR